MQLMYLGGMYHGKIICFRLDFSSQLQQPPDITILNPIYHPLVDELNGTFHYKKTEFEKTRIYTLLEGFKRYFTHSLDTLDSNLIINAKAWDEWNHKKRQFKTHVQECPTDILHVLEIIKF